MWQKWFFFSFRRQRREKVTKVEQGETAQDQLWPFFLKELRELQQCKEVPNSCRAEEAWSVTKYIMDIGKRMAAKTEPYSKPWHEQVQNLPPVPNPAPDSETSYSNVTFCNFIRKRFLWNKMPKDRKEVPGVLEARQGQLHSQTWTDSQQRSFTQHYPIPSTPAHSASLQGILLLQ